MRLYELNSETSYVIDPVAPRISCEQAMILKEKYLLSNRRRHRFCFHQNPEVDLHDIIICYDQTSYIPPNKHVGKVESLIVLEGAIDFYLFSDSGRVYDYRRLSTLDSGMPFYVRVPPNTWHGLRAVGSSPCLIKETIAGPYDRSTLQWAKFAPSENDGQKLGFDWYDNIASECVEKGIAPPETEYFERVSEGVFRSSQQLVTVCLGQLEPIVSAAENSILKRARLCCHSSNTEKLQEMFIVLAKDVAIEESVHLRKDESLTVIDGSGRYIFPNEDGTERLTVPLEAFGGESHSTGNFFTRINRYVPHKIVVDSKYLMIHEATSGPFLKNDTDYRLVRIDQ